MVWSLLRIFLFVALVGAAAWGAGMLLEAEGGVRVSVADTELSFGALESVIALVVLVILTWFAFKFVGLIVAFLRFLNGDETAITRYFARNRERKGYDALADGMMAVASGDGRLALTKASKAERYLKRPDLTTLLTAQAAEMAGDKAKAEVAYKKLLQDDRTRFVGVRGIMRQKLLDGDTDMALKLAERAFALKPNHEETQDILLGLQAGQRDWSGARKTLSAKLKHGSLPRDVHRRRDAVLALGEAGDIVEESASIEARVKAIAANKMSPDLVPAAVMASDSYVAEGKPKYAARVIRKAWEAAPHPDLAAAFARIVPDESAGKRILRFGVLTNLHRDHPETRLLQAELQIAAEDFPAARKALGDLAETDPTARTLTIMAAVERGSGADDALVKGWLARALTARRDPQWVCDKCQTVHVAWSPICDNCDGFDTLAWTRPPEGSSSMLTGAEMLPLIVGQIEPPADIDDVDQAETIDAVAEETKADLADANSDKETANADAPPADFVLDDNASEQKKDAT